MEEQSRNQKIYFGLVLGCILAGMALRFFQLGAESIAFDEVTVFRDLESGMTPYVALHRRRASFVLWLVHWVVYRFFGADDFLMRLPEALEGVLAIAAMYRLGQMLFNRRVGLLSAFLLAISPFHLQLSTWARYYALAALLAVLTLLCAYRTTQTNNWRHWSGFVLFSTLCIFNHPTGLFPLAIQGTFLGIVAVQQALSSTGREWRRLGRALAARLMPLFASYLVILGLALSVSPTLLRLANSLSNALFGVAPFDVASAGLIAGVGGEGSSGGFFELSPSFLGRLVGDFVGGGGAIVWIYGTAFLLGLLYLLATSRRKPLLLIGLWFGLPFTLLRFVEVTTFFKTRYFSFMLPMFLLVVAVGMDALGRQVTRRATFLKRSQRLVWVHLGLTVLLFGGLGLDPLREFLAPQFPDWRGLGQFLKTQALPGDTVVVLPYTTASASFSHYYQRAEENVVVIHTRWDFLRQLEAGLSKGAVWWVVPSGDLTSDEWAQAGFSVHSLNGLTVLHRPGAVSSSDEVLDDAALILEAYVALPISRTIFDYGYIRSRAMAHGALASVYWAQGRQAECDAHFQEALDLFSLHREKMKARVSTVLAPDVPDFEQVNYLALELGQSAQMEALYQQWVAEWPDRQGPHRLLAEWYVAQGRLQQAVDEYRKAIEYGTGETGDHMALAKVYEDLGQMEQALAEYQRQHKLGAAQGEVSRALARAYQRQGNVDLAVQVYEEALRKVPFETELYQELGQLYRWVGDWSRAEELFQRAARINPTLDWPHRELGYQYWKQGLEDQAITEFQRAIEKAPSTRAAYVDLARVFESRGDVQEVVKVYELAAQSNPRFAWPHLKLGNLFARENDLSSALAEYQRAIEIEPWSQQALADLRDLHWDLATSLGTADAYTEHAPLTWWLDGSWIRPYPDDPEVLVGRSVLTVEGLTRPDQIYLHPYSPSEGTYLRFAVQDCHHDAIQVGYGLADQVAGLSNGVRYSVQISADGGNSYTVLLEQPVTDSAWMSHTLPLDAYQGQDVTFQLAVDALGDDSYDWLQTTVRLYPARGIWDLSAHLDEVTVATTDASSSARLSYVPSEEGQDGSIAKADEDGGALVVASQSATTDAPLSVRLTSIPSEEGQASSVAWVDGAGRPLVMASQALVQDGIRGNQVQFHPFGNGQDTRLVFSIPDNPYSALETAYALADAAIGQSDGVSYGIAVSIDGGRTYSALLQREVVQNTWGTATLDLTEYLHRDVTIRLVASSRGNEGFDWLQIILNLVPQVSLLTQAKHADPGRAQ